MKDRDEQIRAYLSAEMDKTELREFENELEQDESLRQELADFKTLQSIIDDEAIDFKQKVAQVLLENRQQDSRWWWVAAACIPIFIIGYYLVDRNTQDSIDYFAYYEPYPDLLSTRKGPNTIDLSAYNDANYQDAITTLSQHKNDSSRLTQLYLAVAYLYENRPREAQDLLRKLPDDHPLAADFQWYRSFALLQQGNIQAAKTLLESDLISKSIYAEKAAELSATLD